MLFASLFQTLVVQPIFNLLVFIYALIPGHNFGLAIILFTIAIRLLMWPLIRKQLHQAKAMRALQPEIKRIKTASKGDRQKESALLMELYKERSINPFGSFGVLIVQLIVLFGLYQGLTRVIGNPQAIIDYSYSWLRQLEWLKTLSVDITKFDATLFGIVDLKRAAVQANMPFYIPGFLLVAGSALAQYYQSKQLMPQPKEARSLRSILRDAGEGKQADSGEVNAAISRSTRYLLPAMIFLFTINLPSALSLYWLVGGIVAYIQQARILQQDETEMEVIADKPAPPDGTRIIIDGEVIKDTISHKKASKAPGGKAQKAKVITHKKRRKK